MSRKWVLIVMLFLISAALMLTIFDSKQVNITDENRGCVVGISNVGCENIKRTIIVSKNSDAQFRAIQEAVNLAKPGDEILVRGGIYEESVNINVSGEPKYPITLRGYTGENPVIQPRGNNSNDSLNINGSWIIIDGFEIRNGWDGIVVNGSNNLIRNNYIHNSGDSCLEAKVFCGQGILVVSTNNIAVENNVIERNGLKNFSPWHMHGIYLSDFYSRGIYDVTVIGNTLKEHGGSGVQLWNVKRGVRNILIKGNKFENNALGVILTNAENVLVEDNTFTHLFHPQTNAPRTPILWLENSNGVIFRGNKFVSDAKDGELLPSAVIYTSNQKTDGIKFIENLWELPDDKLLY